MARCAQSHSPSRRRFLTVTGLSLCAAVFPLACSREQPERLGWLALGQLLTGLDEEESLLVGQIHRDRQGLSRRQLIAALPDSEAIQWRSDGAHLLQDVDWESVFEDQVRRQFLDGRTDEAGGWILSELELTVLALAAGIGQ